MGDIDTEKLAWALKMGDVDEVKDIIKTVEHANISLNSDRKPLHIVADYGHVDVMDYLISKGADVNATDGYGFTPLVLACLENHYNCVKFLLEKGADKNQKTPEGTSACKDSSEAIQALFK